MKDKPLIIKGSAVHTEDLTMELYDCGDSKPITVDAIDWGYEEAQIIEHSRAKSELINTDFAELERRVMAHTRGFAKDELREHTGQFHFSDKALEHYILPIRAAEPIYDMLIRNTHEMSRHSRFMNPAPITNHQKKKRDVIKARRAKDKANRKRGR